MPFFDDGACAELRGQPLTSLDGLLPYRLLHSLESLVLNFETAHGLPFHDLCSDTLACIAAQVLINFFERPNHFRNFGRTASGRLARRLRCKTFAVELWHINSPAYVLEQTVHIPDLCSNTSGSAQLVVQRSNGTLREPKLSGTAVAAAGMQLVLVMSHAHHTAQVSIPSADPVDGFVLHPTGQHAITFTSSALDAWVLVPQVF